MPEPRRYEGTKKMKKNIQFGGDTGTDADYQYEHDQLNELPDNYDVDVDEDGPFIINVEKEPEE